MIIFPAIDIKNRECVRLFKGDFATAEKVAADPLTTALGFERDGAKWLHTVDLDGAKAGRCVNRDIFEAIASKTSLKVELGGGIRNMTAVEEYLDAGISRVILGSAAVKDPAFVKEAVKKFGERIAVGIDARSGFVSADGWTNDSTVDYIELAKKMCDVGVKYIIFTDIDRDGTMSGPNFEQLKALSEAVPANITASGGIRGINDLKKVRELGLYGAICGKSIYCGALCLKDALKLEEDD